MTEPELIPIDELIPPRSISKIDRDRAAFFGLVARQSDDEVLNLLGAVEYGPDRVVDLRRHDSPVKAQIGPRCTAYAIAAAMEHRLNASVDMSETYLWKLYQRYSTEFAIDTASKHWLRTEDEMTGNLPGSLKVGSSSYLENDFRLVIDALDMGSPCVVALQVPTQMSRCAKQIEADSGMKRGGHALCVSGYKIEKTRPYFLVKNSWGIDCGDAGYQWVSNNLFALRGYAVFWSILGLHSRPADARNLFEER